MTFKQTVIWWTRVWSVSILWALVLARGLVSKYAPEVPISLSHTSIVVRRLISPWLLLVWGAGLIEALFVGGFLNLFRPPQCNQLAFLTMEAGGWLDVCVPMFISCRSAVLSHYLIDDCYQNGQLWPHRLASFQTAHCPPHFLFILGCHFHKKLFKMPVNTIVFADPKGCKRYLEAYSPMISTFNHGFH